MAAAIQNVAEEVGVMFTTFSSNITAKTRNASISGDALLWVVARELPGGDVAIGAAP